MFVREEKKEKDDLFARKSSQLTIWHLEACKMHVFDVSFYAYAGKFNPTSCQNVT